MSQQPDSSSSPDIPSTNRAPSMGTSPALTPSTWARATVPLYATYPAAAFTGASSTSVQGRYSEPITLRGNTIFIRLAVVFNMGLWLIRDSSLSSFLLYSVFVNAVLYFFIVRGEPFNLALLIESAASVTAKNNAAIPAATNQAATVAAQQVHALRTAQPAAYMKPAPAPVAYQAAASSSSSAAFNKTTSPAPAASVSAPAVSTSSSTKPVEKIKESSTLQPPKTLDTEPVTPLVEPILTPSPQAIDSTTPAAGGESSAEATSAPRAALRLPSETTPVVLAGATARHSSQDEVMSWTRATGTSYDVRIGPNYKKYGKKAPSKNALYECVGVDVFGAPDGKLEHIAQHLQLPWIALKKDGSKKDGANADVATAANPIRPPEDAEPPHELDPVKRAWDHYEVDPDVLRIDEELGVPTMFIINFQIPTYAPSYFGSKEDGEGFSILLYYQITAETRAELRSGKLSGALQLLKEFVANAHAFEYHSRFKCIPRIVNPQEAKVGIATRQAMKIYNSKPFLTGPHCHAFIRGPGYMEADIDVHRFCLSARKGAFGTLDALSSLIVDVGFVIEAGRDGADNELPEQILACGRVAHLDPMHAKSLASYMETGKKERAARMASAK